jgi:hypothetical protein
MATIVMTVNTVVPQSLNAYELRKAAVSGFRRIVVARDVDGLPPTDPPAGQARGTVGATAADIRASQQVWNELNAKVPAVPFTATIHHTNNVVSDLTFA